MPKKRRFPRLVLSLAIALAIAVAFLLRTPVRYYPHVAVQAGDELTITFLKQGRASPAQCEAAASSIANILQATCTSCQVTTRECLSNLNPAQEAMLSAAALELPSANLPDGVVTYAAPNMDMALAACVASQRAAGAKAASVTCFAPHATRAGFAAAYNEAGGRLQQSPALLVLIAGLALALIVALIARYSPQNRLPGLRFLAELPRSMKRVVMVSADLVLLPAALLAAIALRHAPNLPDLTSVRWLFLALPILTIPVFAKFGLYRAVIRYFEIEAASNIFWGVTLSTALLAMLMWVGEVDTISRLVYPRFASMYVSRGVKKLSDRALAQRIRVVIRQTYLVCGTIRVRLSAACRKHYWRAVVYLRLCGMSQC